MSFSVRSQSISCLTLAVTLCSLACAARGTEPSQRADVEKPKNVVIAIHGWHSGIVVKTSDISPDTLPELKDFAGAEYIEIGWGDWDYYQAADPGFGSALRAGIWSSRSVLHLAGFTGPVEKFFPASGIYRIALSDDQLQRLVKFVSDTFVGSDKAAPLAQPGWYGISAFYPAKGKFHLFRNCNTWVAEALEAAGLPVSPGQVVTAGNLRDQVSAVGVRIENGSLEPTR